MKKYLPKLIAEELGLSLEDIVKPKRGSSRALYLEEVIETILSSKSISEASITLDVGENTLYRNLRKLLPEKFFSEYAGLSYKGKFLLMLELKECPKCKNILSLTSFSKSSTHKYVGSSICKECDRKKYSKYRLNNLSKTREAIRQHYNKNKKYYIAKNAAHRASKKKRTVGWADLEKIKDIYNKCPKGCHVDHIIPLQGDKVSGLHVENNLQYLTAEENLTKGNKIDLDLLNYGGVVE